MRHSQFVARYPEAAEEPVEVTLKLSYRDAHVLVVNLPGDVEVCQRAKAAIQNALEAHRSKAADLEQRRGRTMSTDPSRSKAMTTDKLSTLWREAAAASWREEGEPTLGKCADAAVRVVRDRIDELQTVYRMTPGQVLDRLWGDLTQGGQL